MENYRIFSNREYNKVEISKEKLDILLSEINIDRIHRLFIEFGNRLGKENLNLISKEEILTEEEDTGNDKEYAGLYKSTLNKIYINVEYCEEFDEEYRSFDLIHTLIHEQTHAIARKSCLGLGKGYYDTGFSQIKETVFKIRKIQFAIFFDSLNEAMTEKIARNITRRYIDIDDNRDKYIKFFDNPEKYFSYQPYYNFLEKLIELIAIKTEVSKDLVEQAFVNDYVNGLNLFDTEDVKKELEDLFYDGVLYDIANINKNTNIDKLINKMELGFKSGKFVNIMRRITMKLVGL